MNSERKPEKRCCDPEEQLNEDEVSQAMAVDEMVNDYLLRTRRIWIAGVINESTATHVCSYLQMFSLLDDPIYLYINSPGGCVSSGYAIIDQIQACKCPIYTIVRGQAYSMSAIIAAFGSKGRRYISQNSSMMLHSVVVQSPADTIDRHVSMMNFAQDDYTRKVKALARRTKVTPKQLLAAMNETKWMSSQQAIKMGLVDGIWTPQLERSLNGRKRK